MKLLKVLLLLSLTPLALMFSWFGLAVLVFLIYRVVMKATPPVVHYVRVVR